MSADMTPNYNAIFGCWKSIGIRGDSTCRELVQYVHCRNCPVYSEAAASVFDTALTEDDLEQSTRDVAREEILASANMLSVVIFRVGAEWLALPTNVLCEIVDVRPIHSMPHRRDGVVLGVTNVRGRLVVSVAIRRILHLGDRDARTQGKPAPRMLVTSMGGVHTVFPVDEVHGIEHFRADEPVTVPTTTATYVNAVLPWQGRTVNLIEPQRLLSIVNRSLASATSI